MAAYRWAPAVLDLLRLRHRQRHHRLRRVPTLGHRSRDESVADRSFARKLEDIYNWFTEGFETVDLKDAKALLDELNG